VDPNAHAPTLVDFERLARAALNDLPAPFGDLLDGVVLRVEDWPEEAVLDELGIDDAYGLTGLYSGRPLGEKSSLDTATLPDTIHLYRRPLLDEWADTDVGLADLIRHVVVHEAGHHFGLSDEDMHRLEDDA